MQTLRTDSWSPQPAYWVVLIDDCLKLIERSRLCGLTLRRPRSMVNAETPETLEKASM